MNADEFTQSVQSLGTRYLREYARAVQSYTELLNSVAKAGCASSGQGLAGSNELASRHADFVAAQAPKVLAQISQASATYYSTLAELGMQTLTGYVDAVLKNGTSQADQPTAPVGVRKSTLLFHGTRGDEATNAFVIANHRDNAIDVDFAVTEVVSEDGKQCFRPVARFSPDKCRIAPRAERVVQCSFPLSDEFGTGQDYRGSISVVGFPDMEMAFTVRVEAPVSAVPVTSGAAEPAVNAESAAKAAPEKRAARKAKKKKAGP